MIRTPRLTIRKFLETDALDSFEMNTDPEVMQFIPGKIPDSIADMQAVISRLINYYDKNPGYGVFPAILSDTNEFIGWCVFLYLDKSDKIEVGYRLKKKYWGNGYATEITKAFLKYGFENMQLEEIYGVTHPDNMASQKVLIKSGLNFIGRDTYYNMELKVFKIERKSNIHLEFEEIKAY